MLKKILLFSLFILAQALGQETPPPPEAPYPGAPTEPKEEVSENSDGEIIEGNKFRGTRKIKHPESRQGLFRITSKGEYLYKTIPSPQKNAIAVRLGEYSPANLVSTETGFGFDDIYSSSSPFIALVDYEWQLFSGFGKLGLRAGTGLFFASGNGRFANGLPAPESYILLMLPNSVSTILYLQFWERQPLIPYAEGGLDAYVFNEYRDDGNPPLGRFGGSLAAHAAGGILLPLNIFDRLGMIRLDQEYGINNLYFSAEYRVVTRVAGSFDFSSQFFTGGVLVEF